jgi:hypothetical protein
MNKDTLSDEVTSDLGLFNYAHSYWRSAQILSRSINKIKKDHRVTHPSAPIYFLYVHAIELFLKSHLRKQKSVRDLKKISHNLKELADNCSDLFLNNKEYVSLINSVKNHEINLESRYIKTGPRKGFPAIEDMDKLCDYLYKTIKIPTYPSNRSHLG